MATDGWVLRGLIWVNWSEAFLTMFLPDAVLTKLVLYSDDFFLFSLAFFVASIELERAGRL